MSLSNPDILKCRTRSTGLDCKGTVTGVPWYDQHCCINPASAADSSVIFATIVGCRRRLVVNRSNILENILNNSQPEEGRKCDTVQGIWKPLIESFLSASLRVSLDVVTPCWIMTGCPPFHTQASHRSPSILHLSLFFICFLARVTLMGPRWLIYWYPILSYPILPYFFVFIFLPS